MLLQIVARVRLAQQVSLLAPVTLCAQGVQPGSMQEQGLPRANPAKRVGTLPYQKLPHARLARPANPPMVATVRLPA